MNKFNGAVDDPLGDGFIELVIALGMGILFIFLVMAAQFESYIGSVHEVSRKIFFLLFFLHYYKNFLL
ncbi:hypothetical protein DP73_15605 [Desulfosporosinus sp. HMP52]|nr:hypothetical protein DP73_15605 [Desulfosporosinus sp. HMP52]